MKHYFSFFFFVISFHSLFAQNVSFQWAKDWGNAEVKDIKVDSSGNSVLTGNFYGTVDFDPSASTYSLTAFGARDIFVCKLDPNGNFLWAKSFTNRNNQLYTANSIGNSIELTTNNDVIVTGYFRDTVDFDPGVGVYELIADSLTDMFVLKLDANGNFLWVKTIGGNDNDQGTAIKSDQQGNVYVTGEFRSVVDFDPGSGQHLLYSNFANGGYYYTDVFILKLDGSGNFLWANNIGGNSSVANVFASSMDLDAAQNIYFTGHMLGLVDFDPGPATQILGTPGLDNIYVCKLTNSGNLAWAKAISASGSNDIAVNRKNGNVYVTGDFTGTVDFDPGSGYVPYTSAPGFKNIFIWKLDPLGNYKWSGIIGGILSSGTGNALKIDDGGNLFVGGHFGGSPDFDPGPGTQAVGSAGNTDLFVCRFDTADNFLWVRTLGTTWPESIKRIGLDKYGAVYSVGLYTSNTFNAGLDFDPGPGQYMLTGGSQFCWKLSPCSSIPAPLTNTTSFPGYNCPGMTYSLSAQSAGNIEWYPSITSTVSLGSGQSFVTPALNSGLHTYYAEVNTCTLSLVRTPVTVSVLPTPSITSTGTICSGQSLTMTASGATSYTWSTGANSASISVSPLSNTSYTVSTGNTITGCTNTVTQHIVVQALPTLSITGTNALCTGGMAQLFSAGASTYTWTSGISNGMAFYPTSTQTYTVYGTAANSCTNSAMHTVTVNPYPVVSVNSGSICSGDQFVFVPVGASSYTYSTGTPTVSPRITSYYWVNGTSNGCMSTAQATVTVLPPPNLNISQFTSEACIGGTGTALLTGASTYSLTDGIFSLANNTGSFSFTPTVAGIYTMSGTDSHGCSTSITSMLSLFAIPTLTVSNSATICPGSGITVSATGAGMIVWGGGAYLDSMKVYPTSTTTYSVIGYDIFNYTRSCSDTGYVTVTVNPNCQDVWPGDANSDGLVDNTDVLELGLHFTQTGPARATVSNAWQSYYATNWTGTITNGKNVNHSDCNGDGTIDANDTLAIFNNYGLTHAFRPAESTIVNPQLSIVPDQNVVAKGNWGSASMFLGEASAPISNINGLAFTVTFDQSVIDANSFYIEYPASFLNAGNQNLKFQKSDFSNGKLYTATTHTNNVNASGYGKIAVLHYKIKSGLTRDEVLNIGITQTKQSNASGVLTPITAGTATVAAIGASVGIDELSNGNNIGLYPNPATISAIIQSSSLLQKVEVLSLTGQIILSETTSGTQHQLDLSSVANGVYFVNIYSTDQKILRKKLVVQK